MLIFEAVFQGVRGLPPLGVLRLEPGPGVIVLPPDAHAVLAALFHAIHPEAFGGSTLVARGGGVARVSVGFRGRDQKRYRLVRDLTGDGARLGLEPDAGAGEPRLLSGHLAEVAQYFRVNLQMPSELAFERLSWWRADRLGARAPESRGRAGQPLFSPDVASDELAGHAGARGLAPRGPSLVGAVGGFGTLPESALEEAPRFHATNALVRDELETSDLVRRTEADPQRMSAELAKLRGMRAELTRIRRDEGRREALAVERDELGARLEGKVALEQAIAERRPALEPHRELLKIAADLEHRAQVFQEANARRRTEDERAHEELALIEADRQRTASRTLLRDPVFLAGVVVAVLLLVLGLALQLRWILALHLLGSLTAAAAALQFADREGRAERLDQRERLVKERLAKVERQWELETGLMRRLMTTYEVDSPSALTSRAEEAQSAAAELEGLVAQLDALLAVGDLSSAEARLEAIEAELARQDDEQAAFDAAAGEATSVADLDRRIAAIEGALARAPRPSMVPLELPSWAPPPPRAEVFDPGPTLIRAAAEVLGRDPDKVAGIVEQRLTAYVAALTRGEIAGARLGPRGELQLGADGALRLTDLSPGQRTATELALRASLLELTTAQVPLPLFVEDPIAEMDPGLRARYLQLLAHLGKVITVFVTSAQTDVPGRRVELMVQAPRPSTG